MADASEQWLRCLIIKQTRKLLLLSSEELKKCSVVVESAAAAASRREKCRFSRVQAWDDSLAPFLDYLSLSGWDSMVAPGAWNVSWAEGWMRQNVAGRRDGEGERKRESCVEVCRS